MSTHELMKRALVALNKTQELLGSNLVNHRNPDDHATIGELLGLHDSVDGLKLRRELSDALAAPADISVDQACRFSVWWNHKRATLTAPRQAAFAAWAEATSGAPVAPAGYVLVPAGEATMAMMQAACDAEALPLPMFARMQAIYNAMLAAAPAAPALAPTWLPIDTAPQDGRTILLGRYNELGKWRTMRGKWMDQNCIDETWEDPESGEPGWFETCVEADEIPNCWPINPTHWMSLPTPPEKTA